MHGLNAQFFQPSPEIPGNLIHTQIDPYVDYRYKASLPAPFVHGSGGNDESIVWSGWIVPLYTETYTFTLDLGVAGDYSLYIGADGDCNLFIGGVQVINGAGGIGGSPYTAHVAMTAGVPVSVLLNYGYFDTDFNVHFKWQSPSQALQIVPTSALYATNHTLANLTAAVGAVSEVSPHDTLNWTTDNADTSVTLDDGSGPVAVAQNGSLLVSPSHTTTYTLTATGPFGTVTSTATIRYIADPTINAFGLSINGVPGIAIEGT